VQTAELAILSDYSEHKKSNFYYSFFSLPKFKREAIETIYTFCRLTDDIVDEVENLDRKQALLLLVMDELKKSLIGESNYGLLNKLASVIKHFNIPLEYFYELLRGMEMDLTKNRYNTFAELEQYCYRVASTVGLICAEIFGYKNENTKQYAFNLGIALQLTNILRDIKEDAKRGRIYLPLEDLRKFNYTEEDLLNCKYDSNFIELMKYECKRVHDYFRRARKHLAEEDKPLFTAARTMGNIYYLLLLRIERANYNVFSRKIKLSSPLKIFIAVMLNLRKSLPKNLHRYIHFELPA